VTSEGRRFQWNRKDLRDSHLANDDLTRLALEHRSKCQGEGSKVTGPEGFKLTTDVVNKFQATGTLTTTIDGKTYRQPSHGNQSSNP
jgi:hypothetical protein